MKNEQKVPFPYASPVQHCGEEEPHGSHEWLLDLRRTQCLGTPVDTGELLDPEGCCYVAEPPWDEVDDAE